MKIRNVIRYVDAIKPNAFGDEVKVQWINEAEGYVQTDVMMLALSDVVQYDSEHHMDAELLVKPPHDKLYAVYLCAMVDFANGEYDKYANTMQMYNEFLGEYIKWYTMNFRPADGSCVREGYYLSAYSIAVLHGFEGTEEEWLESIGGPPGKSAYEEALEHGYQGTREEFGSDQARFAENAQTVRKLRDEAADSESRAASSASAAKQSADDAAQNVRSALAEAKESGEFDGPPGKQGEPGEQGEPGNPGVFIGAEADMPEGTRVRVDPKGKATRILQVDDTLSQTGYAADAAAVGKKLSQQSEAIADLKENGTVPKNVALLEDVPEGDTNGDFIPMLSPNGTEYRFAIRDNGFPIIVDVNGNVVWFGTSGGTDEEPDGGETPDDGGEGGETPDAGANWTDGVPYTLTNITPEQYVDYNTGKLKQDSSYAATDYLYVYGAGWLYIPGDCRYSALYDISKQYVGTLYGDKTKEGYFEISENAVYIRISGDWVNESEKIVPYADVTATWSDGETYDLGSLAENVYISNGAEIAYNGWSATDYINCAHANKIVIEGFSPIRAYCAYYDMKRRYVPGFWVNDGVVSIPTGVCYFRISGSNSDMAKLIVTPYAQ